MLPGDQVSIGLGVSDVEHDAAAFCAAIKCRTKALVALLACGVPNLQGDNPVIEFEDLVAKVSADGRFVGA